MPSLVKFIFTVVALFFLLDGNADAVRSNSSRKAKDFASQMKPKPERIEEALLFLFKNNTYFKEAVVTETTQPSIHFNWSFPCIPFPGSKETPTSVHKLTPGDIKVVAAMGDSLTAGNGANAKSVLGLLLEYHGLAFAIGGDPGALTLPNLLRRYNPKLTGFALGIGKSNSDNAHFDAAVPGAKSIDLMDEAHNLIKRMVSDNSISFVDDWKVINVFIGSNDLCDSCKEPDQSPTNKYIQRIQDVLDYLHETVPRAFVNLLPPLDVYRCHDLNIGYTCKVLHVYECICGAYLENITNVKSLTDDYQKALGDLVDSGRYDTRDDFTVVFQPFFVDTEIPRHKNGSVDLSYFAPDCFHFSFVGHGAAATALWNNMFERVGSKSRKWIVGEDFVCPSIEKPYLYTRKNSY